MPKTSVLNYAYALGKVRALENFLIKDEVFEEAQAAELEGALRLFVESDLYGDELMRVKDSRHLEAVLEQEKDKVRKLVQELLLDKELLVLLDLDDLEGAVQAADNYPSSLLKDYIWHLVDMHNIKSFLRLYILTEAPEKLDRAIAAQGFIKKSDFLQLYTQDLTAFLNKLEYVQNPPKTIDYTYYLGEAIQKTVSEKSFIYLERAVNDFLIRVLKAAKYVTFGPEPVVAYYFAKINEINLMRLIILAKLNGIQVDLVKERLNAVYA